MTNTKWVTRMFDRETLLDVLDSDAIISNEIVDESRWSNIHEIVFEYDGKLYETSYSVGKTEHQEESPWEYESDPQNILCTQVEEYETKVIRYRPIVA